MTDHSDEPPKPAADQEPSGAERVEPGAPETPPSRPPPSPLVRAIRTAIAIVIAIGAAIFVTVFTIDLGPGLRARAEREGSKFIERPMHIGRLWAQPRPGVFVVEPLMIDS